MNIGDKFNTFYTVEVPEDIKLAIADKLSKGEKVKSITVRMEATHSGKPNGNFWIYTPHGMEAGHKTFTSPVYKPVTREHEEDSKTLGRVIKSEYVSYGNAPNNLDRPFDKAYIKDYKKFMASKEYKDPKFKGFGHVELTAKITDRESISKILDNQYGFVSVGGGVKSAHCSICGTSKGIKDSCDHSRGFKYNGETCYYIGGIMNFEHISYVETPADKNAISTLIRDSKDSKSHLQILDFETEKGKVMTIKFEDFDKSNDSLVQHAKELGIDGFTLPATEELGVLDFVFGDEKTFPVADKLSALVAYDLITTKIEDSEDKESVLSFIKDKLDEFEVKDAESELQSAIAESKTQVKDSQGSASANTQSIDLDALATSVAEKIKDSLTGKSKYAETQIKVLGAEVKSLTTRNRELETMLRDSLVSQICAIEKISDSDKIDSLKKRSLVSLKDKLEDLKSINISDSEGEKDGGEQTNETPEEKVLPKDSLKVTDSVDGEGSDNNGDNGEDQEKGAKIEDKVQATEFASEKEFQSAYIKTLKTEGLQAARELKSRSVIKR